MGAARSAPDQDGRSRLLLGGLLSLALGLLLALATFAVVVSLAGVPTRGDYCSEAGIGRYWPGTAAKMVVYLDDGWSGLPPREHCAVYLVESHPPLSAEQPSRQLLAAGAYPGDGEYAWVLGMLLLPIAIWGALALAGVFRPQSARAQARAAARSSSSQ